MPTRSHVRPIVSVLDDAFAPLMKADPVAFRAKYRTMASDPHAFYRGTACLFYNDVVGAEDPFVDERSGRIWVHGDLHVENFGTYLNSDGRLVFDVNDFDEAYLGHFTWDLRRFAASMALVGWQKALPEEDVRRPDRRVPARPTWSRSASTSTATTTTSRCTSTTPKDRSRRRWCRPSTPAGRPAGRQHLVDRRCAAVPRRRLRAAARRRRAGQGAWRPSSATSRRSRRDALRARSVLRPARRRREVRLRDRQRRAAGLQRARRGLQPGARQRRRAVDEAGQHAGHQPVRRHRRGRAVLRPRGPPHRGQPARAPGAHRPDARLHQLDGVGYVVSEVSPYEVDLDWSGITEPDDIAAVVDLLGRATAKIHCASDEDSEQDLVDFQVEEAIAAASTGGDGSSRPG